MKERIYVFCVHFTKNYLFLLPIVYGFSIVAIFGVNVLFWDEWMIVGVYEKVLNSQNLKSIIKILFLQHNEHRIFFPLLIMLIIRSLSHFNVRIDMFFTQSMVLILYLVIINYLLSSFNLLVNYLNILLF